MKKVSYLINLVCSFFKKIILAFLILFPANGHSQPSGWFWSNPLPQGNDLYSVDFVNSTTGYAVGERGTFLKTTNAGSNWSLGYIGDNFDLWNIEFTNHLTGYVVKSNEVVLKTTNGGNQWNAVFSDTSYDLISTYFLDNSLGYVLCNHGKLLRTTNGGINWSLTQLGTNYYLQSMSFPDNSTGYIVGSDSTIFKSTNSGINWFSTPVNLSGASANSIYFTDYNIGFIAGYSFIRGVIFKTVDGGYTWSQKYLSSIEYSSFQYIEFAGMNSGFAFGSFTFASTSNAGENWTSYLMQDHVFQSGSFLNSLDIVLVGLNGAIFRTTTYGASWDTLSKASVHDLLDMYFTDNNTGYAVGGHGAIVKTTNGGNNWFTQKWAVGFTFFSSVFFLNQNTGVVVGNENQPSDSRNKGFISSSDLSNYGIVYRTTDGGNIWNFVQGFLNIGFTNTYFADNNTGFVIGYPGKIMKTTNGGINFIELNSGTIDPLYSLVFTNSNTGFVCGYNGKLIKTTNGGANWFSLNSTTSRNLNSISFLNDNTGFVAGDMDFTRIGAVMRTTNGGISWGTIFSKTNVKFYSVEFLDVNTGYVTGDSGISWPITSKVYKTTNGGQNWNGQALITNRSLKSIWFTSQNTGFLCGDDGVILKTTTGGEVIGVSPISNKIPKRYFLHQNYPNPFNPVTKIRFDVSPLYEMGDKGGFMRLTVYDILGREVAVLVNEPLTPGVYEAEWDGANNSSGLYFYTLQTNEFTATRKMVLLK